MMLNIVVAWVGIVVGLVSGTVIGLFFHDERWLGGYDSWRRRMVRLGHIAFLGTGLLNLAFASTARLIAMGWLGVVASLLFAVGAAAMPSVCFLSAWRKPLRHLFFIPVLSLIGAAAITLLEVLQAFGRA